MVGLIVLTLEAFRTTPPQPGVEATVLLTADQRIGQKIMRAQGCRQCHTVAGAGALGPGPSLDGIRERMDAGTLHFFLEKPQSVRPDSTHPAYIPPLSHKEVEQLVDFLESLNEQGEIESPFQ